MKYNGRILDSHLHMHGGYGEEKVFFEGMESLAEKAGYDGKNVAMVPQWDKEFISQNPLGILYKALYPGKVFAYAGFDYYVPAGKTRKKLADQAREYAAMGFDGIKMVELKPTAQRNLGMMWISDREYDELFSFLEENGMPLLLHVGDPATFWSIEEAPAFAKENGWFYGDGSYPSLQELFADTEKMLEHHPKLKVSLAHFYFRSDDIDEARRILETYPNVRFDITPGVEMYGNFSQKPDQWREFFIAYGDRILFGTDNGWGSTTPMQEKINFAVGNVGTIRRFLESADAFEGYGMQLQGIDLPLETLEKIYCLNFEAMAGITPKLVDADKALAYVNSLIEIFRGSAVPFYDVVFPQLEAVSKSLSALVGNR